MKNIAERMIGKEQIIKIHALKNALKMPDTEYRKLIYVNFYPAATSSKDLTFKQAEAFIEYLEKTAIEKGVWKRYEGKERYEELGYREGMAAPAQLRMIEAMWKDISNVRDGEKRKRKLRGWLYKYFKVSDLRFIDDVTVHKVIHALKQMQGRKYPESPESHSEPITEKYKEEVQSP